ncbi:hypothetical protein JXM67_01375 [candidate division WOR-3 bacterium]|nr:hypothetical protein [candidate division WOR-3 bacterium]
MKTSTLKFLLAVAVTASLLVPASAFAVPEDILQDIPKEDEPYTSGGWFQDYQTKTEHFSDAEGSYTIKYAVGICVLEACIVEFTPRSADEIAEEDGITDNEESGNTSQTIPAEGITAEENDSGIISKLSSEGYVFAAGHRDEFFVFADGIDFGDSLPNLFFYLPDLNRFFEWNPDEDSAEDGNYFKRIPLHTVD